MKKNVTSLESLRDRIDCFGNFNPDDVLCLKWCQLNIRCAIARDEHEQIEIVEDVVPVGMEPPGMQ